VKLLFDENLSPKLVPTIRSLFPHSCHIAECGLEGASDDQVWQYARDHAFAIVSKDSDFAERSALRRTPAESDLASNRQLQNCPC